MNIYRVLTKALSTVFTMKKKKHTLVSQQGLVVMSVRLSSLWGLTWRTQRSPLCLVWSV